MPADFDFIAKKVIDIADHSVTQRKKILQLNCPWILSQIRSDCRRMGPLAFWGRCLNSDEIAKTTIVSPAILEVLFSVSGRKISTVRPHAGLQHTYGYLFSLIPTPFGMKRDRWVCNRFETAFGLPPGTFGPNPSVGTLLSHATWLAGSVAFHNEDRLLRLQKCLAHQIAPSLNALSLYSRESLRLLETLVISTRSGPDAEITLRTDLVRMPRTITANSAEPWLLVYSIADSRQTAPQLITLFTVTDEFCAAIESRASKRRRTDIRLRYNAFVPGLRSEPQTGRCRLLRWH